MSQYHQAQERIIPGPTPKMGYSIREVCFATSLGKTTIYRLIALGALRTRKIGHRSIIMHDDLLAFMNSRT